MMKGFCFAAMLAAAGISGNAALGQTPALPSLLEFFATATPEAKSPRIDTYDESWFITGPVSDLANRATEGPNWLLVEGQVIYAYWRFAPNDTALQVVRGLEKFAGEQGYEVRFSCNVEKGDCFERNVKGNGGFVGLLLDKPRDMPRLYAQNMSLVRNYFIGGGARLLYLTKGEGENMTHVQIALADTPAKGVMAITKTVVTGTPDALTGANSMRDQLVAGNSVHLDNMLFDTGSAILLPESRDQMHEIGMMLRDNQTLKLQIIGHTDSEGGQADNQGLSERRAAAVVDALVNGFDIEAGRLTSAGKGEDDPVASNDTSEGRAKNRRVELKLQ